MSYQAPVREQRFVLDVIANLPGLARLPAFAGATPDVVDAVLTEAAKIASDLFAPLNRLGDTQGARLQNGAVHLPTGFRAAYQAYVEGGWNSLGASPDFGGQGLPFVLATAVMEQIQSANMAFSLCMMLSQGAIEALTAHGSPTLQATYLPKLVSGEWTGTMNLTEPQAGSDVGALRTKAERQADGTYLITGQKIYITWGEHDIADNIIHLVLARLPDAPAGTKGISLFLVPKFLVNPDGSLGARNDVHCVSVEHKLGIHASPTCTMSFGDHGQCVGYLIGAENAGMRAMFTMMNHARINVGLQGVAIAERAYQHALSYATTRVQSAKFGAGRESVRIIEHADVRRTLMTQKATIEAIRALTYLNAAAVDQAHAAQDKEAQRTAQNLADFLTPITKAYATDMGSEMTSLALQIFGGMGYVEETGAAQHMRDARIAQIYEGTNGIQAMDLVGRKLTQDGGAAWSSLRDEMRDFIADLPTDAPFGMLREYLSDALEAWQSATLWLIGNGHNHADDSAAAATPYLRMSGLLLGGYLLCVQAKAAQQRLEADDADQAFLKAKIATACFFAEQILPQARALLGPITRGSALFYALSEEQLMAG